MANNKKNKVEHAPAGYEIETVTYVKVPTGEKFPEDFPVPYLRGKRQYMKAEKKGTERIQTSWGNLKQKAYDLSVKDKNVSVTWKTPKKQLVKLTRELPNGVKQVTYYNPVRK